jgi:hypothetical protein
MTMAEKEDFEYNDEFFFKDAIRDRAAAEFSSIWFALYSEKVRDEFGKNDEKTKKLKEDFQWWGFLVVRFAVVALAIAAVEPTLLRPAAEAGYLPHAASVVAAVFAGLLGVTSVLMGYFGMGFAGRKRNWLRSRLLCERIRQWRWQYYCAHIPEILSASPDATRRIEYAARHELAFSEFLQKLKNEQEAVLENILSSDDPSSDDTPSPDAVWAQDVFKTAVLRDETLQAIESAKLPAGDPAAQLVAAYKNIRIGAQKRYAKYLVKKSGPFATHPATQKAWLHKRSTRLLLGIFGLHILILALVLALFLPVTVTKTIDVAAVAMGVLAVILALFALGFRAIEDGLRPSEHLGRLKGYLAEVGSIEEAFDEAKSASTRRNLMMALEKASYKEMVDFLQAGNRSNYVM